MVYYRKYRPQRIDDLDNAYVRETLSSVLKNAKTHAFLFTGPKGLGKTSTARIIAKAVNCENKKENSVEPCNECRQCLSITEGTNLDVLEIDAASNRGIDEIRDLKEKIRLAPVSASKKIYIIDEVHMLTTEAFNALLKTLEEPPAHALFILCTTEPHKIPATIASRCFHLSFHLATDEELVRSFSRIVDGEKFAIDKEALLMIAKLADGGFRDGAKILEEVVAISDGKKITKDLVESKYHISSISSHVASMIAAFTKKEVKVGLSIIAQVVEQGIDMKFFLQEMMSELHKQLLERVETNNQEIKENALSLNDLAYLFDLLGKAYLETKNAVLQQLPLELALINYCQGEKIVGEEEVSMGNIFAGKTEVTVSSLRKKVGEIKKNEALYGEKPKDESDRKEKIETATVELQHAAPNGDVTPEWLAHFWAELITEMKKHNHTVAGLLRGCKIGSFDKKQLVITTQYKFHKERLDDLRTRDALINAAKLLTGKEVEVVVELRK